MNGSACSSLCFPWRDHSSRLRNPSQDAASNPAKRLDASVHFPKEHCPRRAWNDRKCLKLPKLGNGRNKRVGALGAETPGKTEGQVSGIWNVLSIIQFGEITTSTCESVVRLRGLRRAVYCLETNGNGRKNGKAKDLKTRAGDGDRTRDVQGQNHSQSHRTLRFALYGFNPVSRDDAILGSFWRYAVLSLND